MTVALIGVYGRSSAAMEDIARQAVALGGTVHLWALGKVAPALAAWTVGAGPGGRCELLNRCYATVPARTDVVISDDDVAFARGDLATFLDIFRAGGWDLAQPAQPWRGSHASYRFSRRRPWLRSRDTTFVEVGPLLAVRAEARDLFLPLPDWGMGWGVELLWWDRVGEGARLAMVDDVTIRHLSPLFRNYRRADEQARLQTELASRGLRSIRQVQKVTATTRRW